jgi:hypothetical protein
MLVERTQAVDQAGPPRRDVWPQEETDSAARVAKARILIEEGERVEGVAAQWSVDRMTLPGAL